MMITLFKADKNGILRFFTVHDLQRSLLGGFALTVTSSISASTGKDRLIWFEKEDDCARWLNDSLKKKLKGGYRTLYSYGGGRSRGALIDRCLDLLAG